MIAETTGADGDAARFPVTHVVGRQRMHMFLTELDDGRWQVLPGMLETPGLRGIDLVIAGTVEGDIIATDRVEIRPPARIFGSVSAARIAIGEGAVIEGEIHMTGGAQPHRFEEKRHRD